MSHVTRITLEIHSLEALARACPLLGCEFVWNQQTYKWFGQFVGDSAMPQGFTKEELGRCLHAIRVKNGDNRTYEVGIVKSKTKPGTYELLWDFWQGGYGLQAAIGADGNKLKLEYGIMETTVFAESQKYGIESRSYNAETGYTFLTIDVPDQVTY